MRNIIDNARSGHWEGVREQLNSVRESDLTTSESRNLSRDNIAVVLEEAARAANYETLVSISELPFYLRPDTSDYTDALKTLAIFSEAPEEGKSEMKTALNTLIAGGTLRENASSGPRFFGSASATSNNIPDFDPQQMSIYAESI
jgi:hypothetical protein